ncbi:MAG: type II CAAX endopeptidase family protein [Acidobacteriota bacterium]
MNEILFNSVGRLKSGWRFTLYLVSFFVIYFVTGIITLGITYSLTQDPNVKFLTTPAGLAVTSFVSFIIATGFGWLYGKLFEDLPIKALGWVFNRTWLKDFLFGLFFGGFALTIAVVLAMPTSGISLAINQNASVQDILLTFATSFGVFLVAGAFEEVFFRGYLLQTLLRGNQIRLGILLTAVLFALAHNNNPGAGNFALINTFIAGIWFGIAYLKTRSLWLTFGLHLSWNWFQGAFYGINVSGISDLAPSPLFRAIDQGPTWLTGGHYGIEGGLTCTIALIVSTILIWFLPILKPTEEMLALTSKENPVNNLA